MINQYEVHLNDRKTGNLLAYAQFDAESRVEALLAAKEHPLFADWKKRLEEVDVTEFRVTVYETNPFGVPVS